MNIGLIPEKAYVALRFSYIGDDYEKELQVCHKTFNKIYVPSIKDRNHPIHGNKLEQAALIYKTDQGYYEFKELNIRIVTIGDKFLYEIQSDYIAERQNRRAAFRVPIGSPTNVKVIEKSGKTRRVSGVLHDLSALGMAVILYNKLEVGNKLEVNFNVTDKASIKLVGDVVRIDEITSKKFLYGCKFDDRSETLGKALLRRQLEDRRRKLNS